jgi:hypothetical protein
MRLRPVPRVAAENFRPSRLPGEPRVVNGLVETWPARTRWTPDYLEQIAGDVKVNVHRRMGPPRNFGQTDAEGGSLPFREYLRWVLETSAEYEPLRRPLAPHEVVDIVEEAGFEESYSLDAPLASLSDALVGDVEVPGWYDVPPRAIVFWCSILGNSSGLHFDLSPNCNVQVRGRKHVVLFAAAQTPVLYRYPQPDAHCAFDPTTPDFERFPRAREAEGWECTLDEGEALYIPIGWYHQVTVVSPWAINVNFWWPRPFPQGLVTPSVWPQLAWRLRRSASALYGSFEARRNTPCASRNATMPAASTMVTSNDGASATMNGPVRDRTHRTNGT